MRGQVMRSRTAPLAAEKRPVVVKLGGSVVRSGALPAWLDAIAAVREPIIVVPGGGALADEVRACQTELGFGDPAAHRMALLAMDQLAWAVAGLRPGFAVGATETELQRALDQGQVAVWAPYAGIAGRTDIENSWRLTSDSLALWLAGKIGAERCYLIKSIARQGTRMQRGAACPRRYRRCRLPRHAQGHRRRLLPARPRRSATPSPLRSPEIPNLRRRDQTSDLRSRYSAG